MEEYCKKPELLAPAGDRDALLAALTAGADAIYLGVDSFNARRNAPNFTLEALPELCDLVHLAGRRLYLTLNTMVLPHEVNQAQDIAYQAWRAGIDALIVQDLGLIGRLAQEMPQLELHASTQMNLHSTAAVQQAAALGISRVTLSRELSLAQITQIAQAGVPLEVFAHGALCVCYSGQCLFSSLVGQRSANRGLCAQACRLPYQLIDTSTGKRVKTPGKHLLSPADLATIHILPQLVASGVASLKLEGRMKSASYVATVTRLYRQALDALFYNEQNGSPCATPLPEPQEGTTPTAPDVPFCHCGPDPESITGLPQPDTALLMQPAAQPAPSEPPDAALEELAETFSRGFTTAYLQGERGNAMMSYMRPNNQGVQVGRVAALEKGLVAVALTKGVCKGDVLEFRTSRGRSTVTLTELWNTPNASKPPVAEAAADTRVWLKVSQPVSPADRVFRVRNAQLLGQAATHYDNTLFQGNNGLVPIHAQVTAHLDHPLQLTFTTPTPSPDTLPSCHSRLDLEPRHAAAETPPLFQEGSAEPPTLTTPTPSCQGTATGEPLQPARTKPLTADDIREHIGRVGGTPFSISSWDIQLDPNVGLGFSALHKLRTQALENLTNKLLQPWQQRSIKQGARPQALAPAQRGRPRVAAIVCNAAGARAAIQGGAELIYLHALSFESTAPAPTDPADPTAPTAAAAAAAQAPTPKLPTKVPIVHLLPAITHNEDLPPLLQKLSNHKTPQAAVANNLAQISLLKEQLQSLEAGPSLGICNKEALDLLARLGLTQAWLSPELSFNDIAPWAPTATLPLALTIVGRQELMVTEHCLLMAQGPCDQRCDTCARRKAPRLLEDRKGYLFPVRTDQAGRSHLFNSVPLDLVPSMPELISLGIATLVVDGTLMTTKELRTELARVTRARDLAIRGAGTLPKREAQTTGHFFRGVY